MSTNNPRFEPKLTSIPEIPKTFGDDGGHFYSYYDDLADELDEDMVKSLKAQLDGILIFAGLFAGVNSAFLALTLPEMSANPADDTNALLLQLVTGGNGSIRSPEDLPSATFAPSPAIFPVNVLFSLSLTLALVSSFLAVIGQQWLVSYRKRSGGGAEHQRWEQLRRYLGAKRWRLEAILDDILPGLLQFALVIFCIGFVAYLRTLSKTMCYVIAGPMAIAGVILLLMGIAGAWDQWCPFKSPLSHLLQMIGNVIERHQALFLTIRNSSLFFLYLMVASKRLARNIKMLLIHLIDRIICRDHSDPKFLSLGKKLWESLDKLVPRALNRSGESEDHLKAIAAQRVLCTSEDFNALVYTAVNLHGMTSKDTIQYFLDDDGVQERLKELCTPSQGLLAGTLSRALIRLAWVENSVELLAEPRYRLSFNTDELPCDDIITKFNKLSGRLYLLSVCVDLAVETTHWNDSLELAFYFRLLCALCHRDPTNGAFAHWVPSPDNAIEKLSALQHCPLRVVGLVAHMRNSINKSTRLPKLEPKPHKNSPAGIERRAQEYSAQMKLVREFIKYRPFELEFERPDGNYRIHVVGTSDTVLGLIHSAFDSGIIHPTEKVGTTDIWLLEQLLVYSVEKARQSGWEVVFHRSVDLLCKLGLFDEELDRDYQRQRYCWCMRVLSRCLQVRQISHGVSLGFEGDGYGLDKLVKCLESFLTDECFDHFKNDVVILSSWLEMRDTLVDPSRTQAAPEYREVYPRLKAAFDIIESRIPGFRQPRNFYVNPAGPSGGLYIQQESERAQVYRQDFIGSATNGHVVEVSQETGPAQTGQINSGWIPGNEVAVMVGSVPEGGAGDRHQQEQFGNPS